MRVFELAAELGIPIPVMVGKLFELGWPEASSDAALLSPERAEQLRAIPGPQWTPAPEGRAGLRRKNPRRVVQPLRYGRHVSMDRWRDCPPVTAAKIAPLLEVRPATIRQWAARGYLSSVGKRGRAHLYAVDDLLRVWHQVNEHKPQIPHPSRDPLLRRRLDELVTAQEAAALAGVAPSTIRMWVARGLLAPVSSSRPHRYTIRALRRAAGRLPDMEPCQDAELVIMLAYLND